MKTKAFMGIMLLVAAMIFSASGTCFAQETKIIDPTLSGTTRLFYGPVFSWINAPRHSTNSGASAYGIIGDPFADFGGNYYTSATPFAVARHILDAGLQMNTVWADDSLAVHFTGVTPTSCPVMLSGETNAFVVSVRAGWAVPGVGAPDLVANFTGQNTTAPPMSGVTLLLIDGQTMTANWVRGIPEYAAAVSGPKWAEQGRNPPYYPTQLTVWTPNENLDATGATIYGTSMADLFAASSGASVWSFTNWGALAASGTGTTAWPFAATSYYGTGSGVVNANTGNAGGRPSWSRVDGFIGSPVISGESVFYVGYASSPGLGISGLEPGLNGAGITLYQLDKDDLGGGVINAARIQEDFVAKAYSHRFMPTPVASGGSIFVVGYEGGVTVYNDENLAWGNTGGSDSTAGYLGQLLLPANTFSGVTASPVVLETGENDPYIIMCGSSAVTCWNISDGLASIPTQRRWWYDFAAHIGVNSQIWGTPAVADGYVFVPVADFVGSDGAVYAFDIDATPDLANGELQWAEQYNLNSEAVASPILIDRQLWAFSFGTAAANNARVTQWDVGNLISDDYSANYYWTQFKFDAAKTGDGTLIDDDDDYVEGSSGCFLSTIR
ncbi:MAG: PQQ-binding-like beta-propeller repeat protein [Desulfobacteraceae bacterium]|jgi:hypothetical protein